MKAKTSTAPTKTPETPAIEVIADEPTNEPQQIPSVPPERDEFCDSSFIDPNAKLPRIQALRGTSKANCGYFIPESQLAIAGWLDYDPDKLITYAFEGSGEEERGLLLQNPRMLVMPRTSVLALDREQSQEQKTTVLLGYYYEYRDNPNVQNVQYYEVMLLNQDNQPCHSIPFVYAAKGANQATFAQHWQQLCQEITNCHAITNRTSARGKDARFKALCVFEFQVAREQAGDKQKSFACKVASHTKATLDNWKSLFLGYTPELKELAWSNLQPQRPLMLPSLADRESPAALPES